MIRSNGSQKQLRAGIEEFFCQLLLFCDRRDHLTLQVEVPVYPPDLPPEERCRETAVDTKKLSIPIHHLESICIFGPSITLSAPALALCWEHGAAVNYLTEWGRLQARMTGVADTSVTLRRVQFRAADDPARCLELARGWVALHRGKARLHWGRVRFAHGEGQLPHAPVILQLQKAW